MRSTHGAKSKVMTVAEKYVWCVKHRMEAVFASQLQYNYYGQGVRYISDYYEIDDFTNTYQDYVNSRYTKIEDKWIHTDQMVKTPYKEFSAENIEKWMKKKILLILQYGWVKKQMPEYCMHIRILLMRYWA